MGGTTSGHRGTPPCIAVCTKFGELVGVVPLPLHRSTKTDLFELQEFLAVPSGEMFLVLRKKAFIQEMKKGINRGAAGGKSRREAQAEVSEIQGFQGSL